MINKDEYQLLCRAFDKILQSDGVNDAIIANTWLHVLREHPVFLKNYNHLFQASTSYKRSKRYFFALVRFTAISIFRISQSISNKKWRYACKSINQSDVLFVSHLTNEKFIGNPKWGNQFATALIVFPITRNSWNMPEYLIPKL